MYSDAINIKNQEKADIGKQWHYIYTQNLVMYQKKADIVMQPI